LRSPAMNWASTALSSGPVAPRIIDSTDSTTLATARPACPILSTPGILVQVMATMKPPSTSFMRASGSCTTTNTPIAAPTMLPSAAGVGAELHRAMDGDEGGDRHEQAHQRQHGDAAADPEGRGQRRREERRGDQQQGNAGANAFGKELGRHVATSAPVPAQLR